LSITDPVPLRRSLATQGFRQSPSFPPGAAVCSIAHRSMDARLQGGIVGGLKRKILAGESFFLTFFRCHATSAKVACR
jgi:uncharacterized protein (AIM24 family)